MKCKICSGKATAIFSALVLEKYTANYFFCNHCSYLQIEDPCWLAESYDSAVSVEDTGLLKRNLLFSKRSSVIINFLFNKNGRFLDYAGGYGIFVRLMRDSGFDFYWSDPFTQNLIARGFEYTGEERIELLTVFECFEHFSDPIKEIETMLKISKNVLFSTRIFKGTPPDPDQWWYYYLNTGQHISFYSEKTLQFIAQKYNLFLNTNHKSFHLFSTKKLSNVYFNFLLGLSQLGMVTVLKLGLKSKTDMDFSLLTNRGKNI